MTRRRGKFTQRDTVKDGLSHYAYTSGQVMAAVDPCGNTSYDPDVWNGMLHLTFNTCYSYAMNDPSVGIPGWMDDDKPQPGESRLKQYQLYKETCKDIRRHSG